MLTGNSFTRLFVRFVALPLLFIAGVQLFLLSERTDTYFAWTIALPLTAAFLGAGYWAAMVAGYMSWWQSPSVAGRILTPASIAATGILAVATFLHLDRFHLNSPAFLTRFVTWVWIAVYVVTPFIFVWLWVTYGRSRDESMGARPFPDWVRYAYLFQAALMITAGVLLFLVPDAIGPFWPWALTPLTARAVSAWMIAFGLACLTVNRENNTATTLGARISLLAFSVLQLVAVARYFPSFEWTKPLAWVYLLLMLVGLAANAPALLRRDTKP